MNETLTKLQTITVGSGGVSSVTFSSIPQTYTDLVVKYSARVTASSVAPDGLGIQFNGDTGSNYKYLQLGGNGASTFSNSGTTAFQFGGQLTGASATSNTFGNGEIYIPNYTSANYKSASADSVTENNGTTANQNLVANLWQSTSAITSIKLYDLGGTNFVQYSTFTLYGVKALRTAVGNSIKATGGTIVFDGTYIYHTFTSTGAFTPTSLVLADILVVAGGGGASNWYIQNGGGAGGALTFAFQSLSSGTSYAVTVGAGGTGGAASTASYYAGNDGGNSQLGSFTAAVGGGGGGDGNGTSGHSGGSGGGSILTATPGSGTSGQGYAGSKGSTNNTTYTNGGAGGGAGGVATDANGNTTGSIGGVGITTAISGGATTGLGILSGGNYYFAGGGNGGVQSGAVPSAPVGGTVGANSGSGANGAPNSGAGGGGGVGNNTAGGNGGSGVVIVRYKA